MYGFPLPEHQSFTTMIMHVSAHEYEITIFQFSQEPLILQRNSNGLGLGSLSTAQHSRSALALNLSTENLSTADLRWRWAGLRWRWAALGHAGAGAALR